MKTIITIITILLSVSTFGQSDHKFDLLERMKIEVNLSMLIPSTKVVDFNKSDTSYIHVYTNDTSTVTIMKNTYGLKTYERSTGGNYIFYFPKKSSARIITNLSGGGIDYKVNKVTYE
jgi:hypothetical protein|tara:strand:- start:1035 stop:1388 length:354 start_codon:yes stop_codon:yes gene_type:complete